MDKIKVTQDTLYEYLTAHDVKMVRLAEMIGKDPDVITSCFKHRKDMHGIPRVFSESNVSKINDVLPVLADEIRGCLITFGSPKTYTNKFGRIYDPGMIEPLKTLGVYLNITGLLSRLLGWSKNKKASVLCRPNALNYGNISEADIVAVNNEILSIAGVLSNYELIKCEENKDVNY